MNASTQMHFPWSISKYHARRGCTSEGITYCQRTYLSWECTDLAKEAAHFSAFTIGNPSQYLRARKVLVYMIRFLGFFLATSWLFSESVPSYFTNCLCYGQVNVLTNVDHGQCPLKGNYWGMMLSMNTATINVEKHQLRPQRGQWVADFYPEDCSFKLRSKAR